MPQIAKGGKHVFGWCVVDTQGRLAVPEEARREYDFLEAGTCYVFSGSRRSGGFGLSNRERLEASPEIGRYILTAAENDRQTLPAAESGPARVARRVHMDTNGILTVPLEVLAAFGVLPGDWLLPVRGSWMAVGFPVRGPLVDYAREQAVLRVFE